MSALHYIVKYPNRRLYDRRLSRYITLSDVVQLVVAGADFMVVDTKTRRVLTMAILVQALELQEGGARPIFSKELLCELIRLREQCGGDVVVAREYLERSLRLLVEGGVPRPGGRAS